MAQTIIHLQRLSSYGVAFHSYTEPATDNELVRNILIALLSSLAKVEAQKIATGLCHEQAANQKHQTVMIVTGVAGDKSIPQECFQWREP
jgi:hypothetical protein